MTAGDSYAAGEGAPEVNGTYDSGGDPPLIGFTREDWDSHFGDTTTQGVETERCHRSPLSPSGVATTYLAGDFPDVQVDFESVACSGASIIKGGVLDRDHPTTGNKAPPNSGGLLRQYIGADPFDGSHPGPFPPQLDQIDAHLNANGTGFKTLDALILGAGGNDAGFASFVAACGNVITLSSPHDDCTSDDALKDFRDARLALLPGHYDRLDAALHGHPLDAADAALSASHVPEAVLLTAIPAVARKTSTSFCSSEPSGDQTAGVTSSEASMLENTVRIPLDDTCRTRRRRTAGRSSTATSTTSSATRSARPTAGSTRTTRPCAGRATFPTPIRAAAWTRSFPTSAGAGSIPTRAATSRSAGRCTASSPSSSCSTSRRA